MKSYEQSVKEFHNKYGHLISEFPTTNIPESIKQLRLKLIEEEWEETKKAIQENDLVEIADGCADLIYVIVGTCISYGIPIDHVFAEVHRSNMSKTPIKATTGEKYGTKTPKGLDYTPPAIYEILIRTVDEKLEMANELNDKNL